MSKNKGNQNTQNKGANNAKNRGDTQMTNDTKGSNKKGQTTQGRQCATDNFEA